MKILMFDSYKKYLLDKAVYERDENGVIVASIPWYDAYFTQGDSFEEARTHLLEVIEDLLLFKLEQGDKKTLEELKIFTLQEVTYA